MSMLGGNTALVGCLVNNIGSRLPDGSCG